MVSLWEIPLPIAKSFFRVVFPSGPSINESQSGPSPRGALASLQHGLSWLPMAARGEQPSQTSLNPPQLLLFLCFHLISFCISRLFSQQKCKPYAQCLQLFVQGRMGVSALSEIFNISKANNADLFYTLSSFCSSKASEQHRTEQSCREGTSALKRLQRKNKT